MKLLKSASMRFSSLFTAAVMGVLAHQPLAAQMTIPLYRDKVPNSRPVTIPEKISMNGKIRLISDVTVPNLVMYAPVGANTGTAVIICPGGGYGVLAYDHEGTNFAKKFAEAGITAFVLKYRLPSDQIMLKKEIGPLQDAQQAIKIVREGAAQWHIKPNQIGIMGFSAGGHLASTAGTHFHTAVIPNENNTSLRPDFMLLIYPVISFLDSVGHIGSRDNLLGKNPAPELVKWYSNELQVMQDTPPTFLAHASDDGAVKPANSILFYEALLGFKIPCELHIYQQGGHGFGLDMPRGNEDWLAVCLRWVLYNTTR